MQQGTVKQHNYEKVIALLGGLTGAATVSLLHEALKLTVPSVAPRMDLLDMEAMKKIRERVHLSIPPERELYKQTIISELIAYTLYYSLAGGNAADLKGTTLGILAGIGAVELPEKLNLNREHSKRTKATEYLTMGIYIAGGLMAAATIGSMTQLTHKVSKIKAPKIKAPDIKKLVRKLK
ncbi:MAG: hypothetical protein M3R72_01100 [Bacteroidota bacterium]|nr:hypothetical protein [Bacteroidota bacterium]